MSLPADARIRSVIEVETLVGSGVPGDPARIVTTYRDTDGTLLAHRDPWLTSEGLRAFFVARGWCGSHYGRWQRYGDPQATAIPSDFTPAEWFARQLDKSGGPDACWAFMGYRMASGYGRNRHGYTHRYALELALGRPLAPGMEACHHCDNPPCCNPRHLFEGSRLDNERDKTAKGRRNTRKAA